MWLRYVKILPMDMNTMPSTFHSDYGPTRATTLDTRLSPGLREDCTSDTEECTCIHK